MPFYGAEYNLSNSPTPCCHLPKNADIIKIRAEMLDGQRPLECKKCWDLEDKNITSDRQLKNSAFDFYIDKDIKIIEDECRKGIHSTQIIKLYTSNLCNSACVTCGPSASSKWQSLKNIKINKEEIPSSILDTIEWKNVKMLTFVGGEPLHEKKNLEILENLAIIGNTDCFISLVTNGSVYLTEKQQKLFKTFKNLNICISIDGTGKQFEYIRYPLKWDALLKNLQQYKDIGAILSVSFTVSNLNILYYHDIVSWFNEQKLHYNHGIVTFPKQFNIEVLPPHIKKNLPLIKYPDTFDSLLFSEFVNSINEQDKLKNIDIKDYLPELWEIIDNFRKN